MELVVIVPEGCSLNLSVADAEVKFVEMSGNGSSTRTVRLVPEES